MKKILFILLFMTATANATQVTGLTSYATNGTVTSTNLNGNFNYIVNVVNGGLDNTNVDTTNGYRLFKTVAALPAAGTQGAVYFLTADNTLNFDTGAAFNKAVSLNSPANGTLPYYNSGWSSLTIGTSGLPIVSNGTIPAYAVLGGVGGGTGANLSAVTVGGVPYFASTGVMAGLAAGTSGQVLKSNGAGAPTWVNSLASVSDYGTSTSSSTARQATTLKVAYGHGVSISAGSSVTLSNLPFTSSATYSCTVSENDTATSDQQRGSIGISYSSGSAADIYNTDDNTRIAAWICIGT